MPLPFKAIPLKAIIQLTKACITFCPTIRLSSPLIVLPISLILASPAVAETERCYSNDNFALINSLDVNNYFDDIELVADKSYYQLISASGKKLFSDLYEIEAYLNGYILAKKDGYYGLIDHEGQLIYDFEYDAIELLNDNQVILSQYHNSQLSDALVTLQGDWIYPSSGAFDPGLRIVGIFYDEDPAEGLDTNSNTPSTKSYFQVSNHGKSGIIDDSGTVRVPLVYDEMQSLEECDNNLIHLKVRRGNQTGLINQHHDMIVPLRPKQFVRVFKYPNNLISIQNTKLVSARTIDSRPSDSAIVNETLINLYEGERLKSDSALQDLRGSLYKFSKNGKFGVIDDNARIILPAQYDAINFGVTSKYQSSRYHVPILVYRDNKVAILQLDDTHQGLTINKYFDDLEHLEIEANAPGLAAVVNDIDSQNLADYGQVDEVQVVDDAIDVSVLDLDYSYDYNLYKAEMNGKYGIIDTNETILLPIEFDDIEVFEGLIIVKTAGKYGVYDLSGQVVQPANYDKIEYKGTYNDIDWFILTRGDKQAIMNGYGEIILPLTDVRIVTDKIEFRHALVPIMKDGKFGYLNKEMTAIAIPPQFETIQALYYHDNLVVQKEGRKFLINFDGSAVTNDDIPNYHLIDVTVFSGEQAFIISHKDKQGIMDAEGNILLPLDFDSIEMVLMSKYRDESPDSERDFVRRFIISKNGLYGLLDIHGDVVVEPSYTYLKALYSEPYFAVSKYSRDADESFRVGLIDDKGKLVKDFEYIFIDASKGGEIAITMLKEDIAEHYNDRLKLISTAPIIEETIDDDGHALDTRE